ncbi:MAG: anthranilate phosphoribosyltransferase [Myxococcales bacterium]|nr:MAG: anthranilate phosphoribosyltransferase [Myxococcales bacterium]
MALVMHEILSGKATSAQIAAFAVAMRMKGESSLELAAAAKIMREHSVAVQLDSEKYPIRLDTCGTGGDGAQTFNVSTLTAVVVAACGVPVLKHGNRSVSSKCGSADLLEALGVNIDADIATLKACLEHCNICFMYAPRHHPAMRHAAAPRKELAVRTFFNLLGPLTNPAAANVQLLGVYDAKRIKQMAEVLRELGSQSAWVVHGHGGLDEISPSGPTKVAKLSDGKIEETTLSPNDFGFEPFPIELVQGGDLTENIRIANSVFANDTGPYRDLVLMNSSAALHLSGKTEDLKSGVALAEECLRSGKAAQTLERWKQLSE